MTRIPFDQKYRPQIESGQYKVETGDGRPVRIICWDAKDDRDDKTLCCPIIGLVDNGKREVVMSWNYRGLVYNQKGDLFIITDWKGMDDVEAHLYKLFGSMNMEAYEDEDLKDMAKEEAEALLDIFREIFAPVVAEAESSVVERICNEIGATLSLDGNAWCVLLGDNLQEGVSGFGDRPYEALVAFIKEVRHE